MRWIASFALVLAISACGSEVPRSWISTIPRRDYQSDLWRDWYVCNKENTVTRWIAGGQDLYTDDSMVASCLMAHGWRPSR